MKQLMDKIKYLVNKKKSFREMCEELELTDYELIGLVSMMKEQGVLIDYIDGQIVKLNKPRQYNNNIDIPIKNGEVKFLAISDLHLASKWDNVNLVNYAYNLAEKENVNFITNSGDTFEGDFKGKRPDHIYQVKALGLEQLDYVTKHYPKSNIPTYYITGNHEATFVKTCGADMGRLLQNNRPDLTYLGHDLADIKVGKLKIRLRHVSMLKVINFRSIVKHFRCLIYLTLYCKDTFTIQHTSRIEIYIASTYRVYKVTHHMLNHLGFHKSLVFG